MARLRIKKILREMIAERDNYQCVLCGKQAVDIHHCVFKSLSGNNSAYNLVCLCRTCHDNCHKYQHEYFDELFKIQKKRYPNLTKEMMKK